MIFVTVGTNEAPFDRLLTALEPLPRQEEVVVQVGASTLRPSGAVCVEYLAFEELIAHIRKARVVVTHAGVGSIFAVLAQGLVPVVVPRLRRFGEAVDDHQLGFARRLADAEIIRLVEDPAQLPAAIAAPAARTDELRSTASRLVEDLHDWLGGVVAEAVR